MSQYAARRLYARLHRQPRTVREDALAVTAAEVMEQHRVTSVLVVDEAGEEGGAGDGEGEGDDDGEGHGEPDAGHHAAPTVSSSGVSPLVPSTSISPGQLAPKGTRERR